MRPFVITGCGVSGTLYVARLLSTLGIRTGFEEFFTAFTHPHDVQYLAEWLHLSKTIGVSSSFAAPYARLICECEYLVLHQVRNPIEVIRSHIGRETYDQRFRLLPNVRFFFRYLPEADHDDPPIVLAAKYWVYWNRLVEPYAAFTYQVEQMPEALPRIANAIGASIPDPVSALEKYGTKHHGGARDESITLDSLPDSQLKDELVRQAERYGYKL